MCSGYGWYLEKVVVEDLVRLVRYVIPCGRWLSSKEGDGLTVRTFSVVSHNTFQQGTCAYIAATFHRTFRNPAINKINF